MSIFEILYLVLEFGVLIIALLAYIDKHNKK